MTPEQLERLLAEHGAALELFAAQWADAPEDCVQEAMLELVRQPNPPDRVVPWLYRVVRNRAISMRRATERRRRRECQAAQPELWFDPSPQGLVDAAELTDALQWLGDEQREVIVARIWAGLSFEQIAVLVGVSTTTAFRRYEAGLRALRERLGLTWLIPNDSRKS